MGLTEPLKVKAALEKLLKALRTHGLLSDTVLDNLGSTWEYQKRSPLDKDGKEIEGGEEIVSVAKTTRYRSLLYQESRWKRRARKCRKRLAQARRTSGKRSGGEQYPALPDTDDDSDLNQVKTVDGLNKELRLLEAIAAKARELCQEWEYHEAQRERRAARMAQRFQES